MKRDQAIRHPLGVKYFLTIAILFVLFVGCFVVYQHRRERAYNTELLNSRLQSINQRIIYEAAVMTPEAIVVAARKVKASNELHEGLRITLISTAGEVFFDSTADMTTEYENHLHRKEVREALDTGSGYDILRQSHTLGEKYFYSATYESGAQVVVRCALPYSTELVEQLKTTNNYLYFACIITLTMLLIFHQITRYAGRSMSDREKLLGHLRISREGLGVFDDRRRLILSNALFNKYGNLISDTHLTSMEEIMLIPETAPIREFLDKELGKRNSDEEEPCISFSIEKNGSIYMLNCVIFNDGNFEVSINDITRQAAQDKLKHDLTQNIAHEFKTPISSIQGYLEILLGSHGGNTPLPEEKERYFLERCYSQCRRLSNLLQDISTLIRMGDTSRTTDKEPMDLSQTVGNMLQEVALKLEEGGMKVENRLPAHLTINGNQSMIYSIFRNLVDNAISYAGNSSVITITCFNSDDKFHYFSFSDNGTGVAEEHLGRLFERFYRVDKGRSRRSGGTGLGLAIVKNAVAVHGGTISVKNRPGGGLEFIFSLRKS